MIYGNILELITRIVSGTHTIIQIWSDIFVVQNSSNWPVSGTNIIIQILSDIFVVLEGSNGPIVYFLIQGMHITSTILWCKCRVMIDNCDI